MLHSSLEIWLFLVQLVQLRKGNQNNTNFKKSNEIIYKQRYKYKRKWSQSVYPHAILWPCMLAKPTRSYERKVYLRLETSYSPFCLPKSKGHFRVPKTLTFKMRLGTQPFLWKRVLFAWEWKMISISKAEHLILFWNRGSGELGNGLFNWSSLENCSTGPMHKNKQTNKKQQQNHCCRVLHTNLGQD